jgi:hypothetical protein
MTRKHFILIAKVIIRSSAIIGRQNALILAEMFAEELKAENPRFMGDLFIDYIRERI